MPTQDPTLSVVIASVNGWPHLDACLAALHRQAGGHTAQIIVADRCTDGTADRITAPYPDVTVLTAPDGTISELRAAAIAASTGTLVCVIEDHCNVAPDWLDVIVQTHASGDYAAVGGMVENGAEDRLVDRLAFLTEYSGLMPPLQAGEVEGVAGNNVAYRREAFALVQDDTLHHRWEYFIQAEMRAGGARFYATPAMRVVHDLPMGLGRFLAQRYHYSRSFAGIRREALSGPARLSYALATPLLVPLMLYRIGRDVFRKRHYQGTFLIGLPLLLLILIIYALGEAVGYLYGSGPSTRAVA